MWTRFMDMHSGGYAKVRDSEGRGVEYIYTVDQWFVEGPVIVIWAT